MLKRKKKNLQEFSVKPSKFQQIKNTLFSKHYVIQRFGILSSILAVSLIIVFGAAYKNYYDYQNAVTANQVLYQGSFTTSKSNVNGQVVGVYGNKDRTKSFVMLKVEDTDSIPLNANKYQFFMMATDAKGNYQPVSGNPAGSFYIFGSTGYMGFYMVNSRGFDKQILNVVGRINSQIVDTATGDEDSSGNFKKYDQFMIKYNPGADTVKNLSVLDKKGQPSISQLYSAIILNKKEANAKRDLNDELQQMTINLNNIADQEHRLQVYDKVQVPKTPKYIRGDKIVKERSLYYLKTKQVIPGGYNLDWQNRTIEQGFIPQVIKSENMDTAANGEDVLQHMAEKRKNIDTDDADFNYDITGRTIRSLSGKKIDLSADSTDDDSDSDDNDVSRIARLNNDLQNLSKAWSEYASNKEKYQTDLQEKLIELETTYRDINNFSAVNDSDKVLEVYH